MPSSINRLLYLIGFFLCCTLLPSTALGSPSDPTLDEVKQYQEDFDNGLSLITQGEFLSASEVFSKLYEGTQSPRVKLEWARSLFLAGQKKESEKLFREVLDLNPPMMVRERVGVYLEEISTSNGRLEASIGLIQDANPRAVTSDRIINLFGMKFNYEPGFDTKTQLGTSYFINAAKGLDADDNWVAGFTVNGAKFSNTLFDRTSVEESISYKVSKLPKIQAKLAFEQFLYGGYLLYTYPSLSLKYIKDLSNGSYWTNEVKYGVMTYPNYAYLNGPMYNASTSYGYPIFNNVILGLELGLDRAEANEHGYSFFTKSLGIVTNIYVPDVYVKGQLKFVVANRDYDVADPVFGQIRTDDRRGVYFNVIKTDWKIFGVAPSLDLSYEKNDSNINIYGYHRGLVNLNFKKVY